MKLLILISLIFCASAETNEPTKGKEQRESNPQVGANRAVQAFDEQEGFQMTKAALDSLKVQFGPLSGPSPWRVPKASLVHVKHSTGVYRRFENWITLVVVKVQKSSNGDAWIESEDLQAGDEIATAGASFLRMTEADLKADTVDGCAH